MALLPHDRGHPSEQPCRRLIGGGGLAGVQGHVQDVQAPASHPPPLGTPWVPHCSGSLGLILKEWMEVPKISGENPQEKTVGGQAEETDLSLGQQASHPRPQEEGAPLWDGTQSGCNGQHCSCKAFHGTLWHFSNFPYKSYFISLPSTQCVASR